MRDDRLRWAAPGAGSESHTLRRATLTPVDGLRETLISGPNVLKEPACGWPDIVSGASYRVALRRDRVLEIGGPARTSGWDAARVEAISPADDLHTVFDLAGPDAFELLKRGTEITLDMPSRSVVRRLFGLEVLVYRPREDAFRLHVPRAGAEALVHLLRAADAERVKAAPG